MANKENIKEAIARLEAIKEYLSESEEINKRWYMRIRKNCFRVHKLVLESQINDIVDILENEE